MSMLHAILTPLLFSMLVSAATSPTSPTVRATDDVGGTTSEALSDEAVATPSSPEEPDPTAPIEDWPREFSTDDWSVVMYPPQVDAWDAYRRVRFRVAVVLTPVADAAETGEVGGAEDLAQYGVLRMTARTDTDLEAGTVQVSGFEIEEIQFPDLTADLVEPLSVAVAEVFPSQRSVSIAVERIVAALDEPTDVMREVQAGTRPPSIFYADRPAILVLFTGQPQWQPVAGTGLEYAVNTNWDLFRTPGSDTFHMRVDDTWIASDDPLQGSWRPAGTIPDGLWSLPETPDWDETRANLPGRRTGSAPVVFLSTQPSELVVTDGPPALEVIPGTGLTRVANTDSQLFKDPLDGRFYLLVAGRWFAAAALDGPWTFASDDLPSGFARIPITHSDADVLASVPGTPQAKDAVMLASLPRTATVARGVVDVEVVYAGEPEFRPAGSTGVSVAVNSPQAVLRVDDVYYCCEAAVWLRSDEPTGPWSVCDSIPQAIYDLPVESPVHHLSYVRVADSDAESVTVEHDAGYNGNFLTGGLILLGAGAIIYAMVENADSVNFRATINAGPVNIYYNTRPPSYGLGARYDPRSGLYYRGNSRRYGPYGGAGHGAVYNPRTQAYVRGAAAWGPHRAGSAVEAFNPTTGIGGARVSAATPYRAWSSGVVAQGDRWAAANRQSGPRGSAARFDSASGRGGTVARGAGGTTLAKRTHGDLYAGRDGKVYRRDSNGDWSAAGSRTGSAAATAEAVRRTEINAATRRSLDRAAGNRARGSMAAQRAGAQRGLDRGGRGAGRGGGRRGGGRR